METEGSALNHTSLRLPVRFREQCRRALRHIFAVKNLRGMYFDQVTEFGRNSYEKIIFEVPCICLLPDPYNSLLKSSPIFYKEIDPDSGEEGDLLQLLQNQDVRQAQSPWKKG